MKENWKKKTKKKIFKKKKKRKFFKKDEEQEGKENWQSLDSFATKSQMRALNKDQRC